MPQPVSTLIDLFTRPDFQAGLVAGALGLAILLLVSNQQRPARQWGEVFALAVLVAVVVVAGRRLGVGIGVVTLAAGGWLLEPGRTTPIRAAGGALVVAGASLVGWRGGLSEIPWLPILTVVAILIAGAVLAAWSVRLPHDLIGPMVAISAFGIWVTVPETELARTLLGVAAPLALATLSPARARISFGGAFALAGVLVWIVAVGGQARPGSIIGGWAALGALAILPLVQPSPAELTRENPWLVLGIHVAFVVIASRLIGLWESAVLATIASLFVAIGAFLAFGFLSRRHASTQTMAHGPE